MPPHLGLAKFVSLGATVVGTFAALWAPLAVWRAPGVGVAEALLIVLYRLFPFGRGLFEDKVSWAKLSPRRACALPLCML